ncbi:MAG: hypothetical protein GY760_18280 [Deltaproteobacteria bacterium]|nr:hypothetical protein [Deltaproteobacteria bacterium]
MQDMFKNLMSDMFSNVGNMSNLDMKDMDPSKIGLKVLDFQKNAFNETYDAMQNLLQQTEKMMEPLLKNNPVANEEWNSMLKKSQEEIKKSIDNGFVQAESYFSSDNTMGKNSK